MGFARLLAAAAACLPALLIAACFSTAEPVLDAAEGDALPGGPGVFRLLDEDGKPQGRLVVTAIKASAPGQRYRARSETVSDGRPQVQDGELILKHIDGDRFLAQFKESNKKYLLAPAVVTPAKFTVMALDTETLGKIAERHGVRTVQEPVGGDTGAIQSAIKAGQSLVVLTMDGPEIHAPRDMVRAIAMEMAASDEAVPLPDADYTREAK